MHFIFKCNFQSHGYKSMTRICCCCNKSEGPTDFETRCNHHFHKDCLWRASIYLEHRACPKCKTVISKSENVEKLVREGNFEDIKSLSDRDLEELFRSSILSNDMRIASLIIEQVDKEKFDRLKGELLNFVCAFGNVEMFDAIIEIGDNVFKYVSNRNGRTPIHEACKNGHLEIAEKLIKIDEAFHSIKDYRYQSVIPLHFACMEGHVDVVEMLIHRGISVDMNSYYNNEQTPLHFACKFGQLKTVKKLIQLGADVNLCDSQGIAPLHLACEFGHVDIIEELIASGAAINVKDEDKKSPICLAFENYHVTCFEKMIELGADFRESKYYSESSSRLFLECADGNIDAFEKLIRMRSNIHVVNRHMRTPLHEACIYGHAYIVRRLIELNADINHPDILKKTPLIAACEKGHVEVVNELIYAGAKVNIGGYDKITPLHLTCVHNHDLICEILIKAGADVNSLDYNNSSPLHVACKHGFTKIAKMLIESGAKIECHDSQNRTPFYYAEFYQYTEIVDFLNRNLKTPI